MRALVEILTGRPSRRAAALAAAMVLALGGLGCTTARNTPLNFDGSAAGAGAGSGGHGGAGGHAGAGAGGHGGNPDAGAKHDGLTEDAPASTCASGTHNCSGMGCVSDDSLAHCGSSCTACAAPDGGAALCGTDGGACDFTCGASLKKCGGRCVAGCCVDTDCPDQGGKKGQCDTSTNTCSYQNCTTGYKPCGTSCILSASCCAASDCPSACTTCSSGTCVAVISADDPVTGRCAGTCDSTGACHSKRGQPCNTVSAGCVGGLFCSPDNYCCDRACTGSCEACDVSASPGTCTTVADGPHLGHTGCGGSTAACNGSCAASTNGQCVWPTSSCGAPSCTNQSGNAGTTYVGAGTCNTGTCGAGAASSCGGSLLCASATACKTTCAADSDCITGDFCSGGVCTGKSGNGTACTTTSQCTSGACVDGVCCENSCPGLCMACSNAKTGNTNGLCRGVQVGTDPDNECAAGAANSCGQDGTCNGSGACRITGSGIACGTSSCTGSTFTAASTCNGSGTCIAAGSSSPCAGNFACGSSTGCGTTCTERSTTGCIAGYECLNGACVQATVPCGGPACAVANGGQCCVTDPNNTGTNAVISCLPPGASCGGSNILCNGKADCPSGQYCCAFGNACMPGHYNTQCVANISSCGGATMSFAYQVCDPSLASECVSGSCTSYTTCIPGVYVCN